MNMCIIIGAAAILGSGDGENAPIVLSEARAAQVIEVRKIWDGAPHNAFTDLARHQGQWLCVFREGGAHVSPDGSIRVLGSSDGKEWSSLALVQREGLDLRDPKLSIELDGRLLLVAAAADRSATPIKHQTYVWMSDDAKRWTQPAAVGDPDVWLWRISRRGDLRLGIGYGTAGKDFVRLYQAKSPTRFDSLVADLEVEGEPNESAIVFLPDDTALCLLRRDGDGAKASGLLGRARPPYTDWTWTDLHGRIGGPALVCLPDGRLVAGVRLYDGRVRTSLCWLDPEKGELNEFCALPSGGDCGYPGLVWHEGELWVSYYSSHDGKTAIYLARVAVP